MLIPTVAVGILSRIRDYTIVLLYEYVANSGFKEYYQIKGKLKGAHKKPH